jgi:hypothetical protein
MLPGATSPVKGLQRRRSLLHDPLHSARRGRSLQVTVQQTLRAIGR